MRRNNHGIGFGLRHCCSLPGVVELFLLLSHTPINLLLDLSKLKLSAEDLVLLLLEGALGFLQGALELLLLLLKATPLLVQVMDGAATLAKLVEKVLDLVSEVLKIISFNWPASRSKEMMDTLTLFSRLTTSSCSRASSCAAFSLKSSDV